MRDVDWRTEPRSPETLYLAGGGTSLPPDARIVQRIKSLAGYDAMLVITLGGT